MPEMFAEDWAELERRRRELAELQAKLFVGGMPVTGLILAPLTFVDENARLREALQEIVKTGNDDMKRIAEKALS